MSEQTQTQADTDKREQQARANTILHQLGGRRFIAMTGARNIMHDAGALIFSIPARRGMYRMGKVNRVKIALDVGADLYTVTFSNVSKNGQSIKSDVFEGIYADNLKSLFTEATGLDTHL